MKTSSAKLSLAQKDNLKNFMYRPQLLFPDTTEQEFISAFKDPKWKSIFSSGNHLSHEELLAHADRHQAEVLMVRTTQYPVDHGLISQFPDSIKLINIQAGGTDNIDLEAAHERGITVSTVPVSAYAVGEVTEHIFAMIFAAAKRLQENDFNVRQGRWRSSPASDSLVTVAGRTLGVVGYGAIGKAVVKMGQLIGMKPVVNTRSVPDKPHDVDFTDLETLISLSDVIVLCVSLNETSFNLFNQDRIDRIKPGAIVVNIARGLVVHEESIAAAADKGRLFYGADVFAAEPLAPDHPLAAAKNTLLSPHIAWKTQETQVRAFELWMGNVESFFAGNPVRLASVVK